MAGEIENGESFESARVKINGLIQGESNKVRTSRKINGKGLDGDIILTKDDIGLNLVSNTLDSQKPISEPQKKYVNDKINSLSTGFGNASPDSIPAPNVLTVNVSTIGTYTRYGNTVVTAEDLKSGMVQLRYTDGSWVKVVLPIETDKQTSSADAFIIGGE